MSVQRLFALLCLLPVVAEAQPEKKPIVPRIMAARVGLPGPENIRRPRLGAWVPVYVDLYAGKDDLGKDDLELLGEWSDGDAKCQYLVAVPAIPKETSRTALTYYRPGDYEAALRLTLRRKDGATLQEYKVEPIGGQLLDPNEVLVLTLGSPLTGLRMALLPPRGNVADQDGQPDPRADRSVAVVTSVEQMPTIWFGYQAVDYVVLATSSTSFVEELQQGQNQPAVYALREWIKRGGSLVLSVGRNYQSVNKLLQLLGIRAFTLEKTDRVTELPEIGQWVGGKYPVFPGGEGIDVTRVILKEGAISLASTGKGDKATPVIALAPVGMGRAFLVAFDFDGAAFTNWQGQSAFWQKVHAEMGPRQGKRVQGGDDRAGELGTILQRDLEHFEEVSVISFGWVAFFILLYILIVGPLDYWFLKKVVKRLELTWVTFPLVVLIVSVAAYFTAYKLKGNHLRISKIDVVDINLRDGEILGTTWFSIFSPRVQAYTIGLEPTADWINAGTEDAKPFVGTMNAPDGSIGGVERPTSSSFFRRPFQFETNASGLRNVPVPVWASRSFTANWRLDLKGKPLIELSNFGPSRDGTRLLGTIKSHLPVELTEVTLLLRGTPYSLDNLPSGGAGYNLAASNIQLQGSRNIGNWFDEPFQTIERAEGKQKEANKESVRRKIGDDRMDSGNFGASPLMKDVLFHSHEANRGSSKNNGGLRLLDQSWRLRGIAAVSSEGDRRYLNEAILVGRIALPPGTAEKVMQSNVSPTQLWLGKLPGEGEREELKGFLGQDTYVRIYIPITSE